MKRTARCHSGSVTGSKKGRILCPGRGKRNRKEYHLIFTWTSTPAVQRQNLPGWKGSSFLSDRELYGGYLGVMPQNPQSIFLKKTVLEDLYSVIGGKKEKPSSEYPISMKKEKAIEGIVSLTHLEGLLNRHPYDLSGGEQQRLALCKSASSSPEDPSHG